MDCDTAQHAQGAPGGQQPELAVGRVAYARTDGELGDLLAASRDGLVRPCAPLARSTVWLGSRARFTSCCLF